MMFFYFTIMLLQLIFSIGIEHKSNLYYAGRRLGSGVGYYSHAYGIPGLGPFDPYSVDI